MLEREGKRWQAANAELNSCLATLGKKVKPGKPKRQHKMKRMQYALKTEDNG